MYNDIKSKMKGNIKMTTELIKINESHRKTGELLLNYKLFRSEDRLEGNDVILFSLSASVTNTKTGETEETLIRNVTSDVSFAEEIFDLIVRGKVTPMTLSDVICDILD